MIVSPNNNIIGGDQAGRDIDKSTHLHVSSPSYISHLIEEYEKECETDEIFRGIVERLEHYKQSVDEDGDVKGLKHKLEAGNLQSKIPFAEGVKEMYTRKLVAHTFSVSAQKIHAFLLADIYTRFHNYIFPRIADNTEEAVINELLQTCVIEPVLAKLVNGLSVM